MNFDYFASINSKGQLCTKELFLKSTHDRSLIPLFNKIAETADGNERQRLKKKLPAITWQAHFEGGKRISKKAVPSGLGILDIDHIEEPYKIYKEQVCARQDELGIVVAHMTPSRQGLRLVFRLRPQFDSIEENQRWMSEQIGVEFDSVTKDFARLSFIVPFEYFYFINYEVFDCEAEVNIINKDYENDEPLSPLSPVEKEPPVGEGIEEWRKVKEGRESGESHIQKQKALPLRGEAGKGASLFGKDENCYKGQPIADIAHEWLMQTGGEPVEGERNTRLFQLCLELRYICEFNPQTLYNNIPHYGLPDKEVWELCSNACKADRHKRLPVAMKKVLATFASEEETETDEQEETLTIPSLPQGFREFVDMAPDKFKGAVVVALLPIWGTLLSKLSALYLDNSKHSPSFQTIVVGEQASGKSFVRRLQEVLLKQIMEEDDEERAKFQDWQRKMQRKKNAQDLPEKPEGIIRFASASTTNSRLYEMMQNARGLHMITIAEEIDEVTANMGKESLSSVLRNAYDNTRCGRDCKTAEATTVMVMFYWNTLFCGTEESVRKFFKNNAKDGSVSRTMFIRIIREIGEDMPIWKLMPSKTEQRLQKLVSKAMLVCRDEEGEPQKEQEMKMNYLNTAMKKWLKEQQEFSIRDFSTSRDTYKNRCAVDGFRAGMVADWLYRNTEPKMKDRERERKVIEIARFIAEYCLENLIEIFPLEVENEQPTKKKKKNKRFSLFEAMSDEFSITDVNQIKESHSIYGSVYSVINRWKETGLIEKTGISTFKKIKKNESNRKDNSN